MRNIPIVTAGLAPTTDSQGQRYWRRPIGRYHNSPHRWHRLRSAQLEPGMLHFDCGQLSWPDTIHPDMAVAPPMNRRCRRCQARADKEAREAG